MSDAKRDEISRKVRAAASRNVARAEPSSYDRAGEKVIEMKDKFTSFARKHPIATVAGGLAVGVLVSALLRGSPTRKAGRAIGKKTAGLAGIVADMAIAYGLQAFDAAGEARKAGTGKLDDWRQSLSDSARDYSAGAANAARNARKSIGQAIRNRIH